MVRLMARAARTRSNFFLFSFFFNTDFFKVSCDSDRFLEEPESLEIERDVKKRDPVKRVFSGNFFEFLNDYHLEITVAGTNN